MTADRAAPDAAPEAAATRAELDLALPPRAFLGAHRHRVEFGECDAFGIVFFPHILSWINAALWAYFEGLHRGIGRDAAVERTCFPLTGLRVAFVAPIRWRDEVRIVSACQGIGRTSFVMRHAIETDRVAVQAETAHVLSRLPGHPDDHPSAIPISPDQRDAMLSDRPGVSAPTA